VFFVLGRSFLFLVRECEVLVGVEVVGGGGLWLG